MSARQRNFEKWTKLFQIFVEPSDGLIQSIGLVLRVEKEMTFAGINDEFCRHTKRF
jgi:hypothetical protein